MQAHATLCARFGVRDHTLNDLPGLGDRPVRIDQTLLELGQERGPMIGGSPDHGAVDTIVQMCADRRAIAQAAVQYHGQLAAIAFQSMHEIIFKRWNLPILLGRQTAEDGDTRVHDQRIDSRGAHSIGEGPEKLLVIAIVNADSALDRHGQMSGVPQTAHAVRDQRGLEHEAGPE
jgi:hypothetical protein